MAFTHAATHCAHWFVNVVVHLLGGRGRNHALLGQSPGQDQFAHNRCQEDDFVQWHDGCAMDLSHGRRRVPASTHEGVALQHQRQVEEEHRSLRAPVVSDRFVLLGAALTSVALQVSLPLLSQTLAENLEDFINRRLGVFLVESEKEIEFLIGAKIRVAAVNAVYEFPKPRRRF